MLIAIAAVVICACTAPDVVPATARTTTPAASISRAVPAQWPFALDAYPAAGLHGMVVTDAPLATRVGAAMLEQGGNAVDAAVATAFALAVVLPSAGNLGGGGFAVVAVGGERAALDFRETAPAAAHRDMYVDAEGHVTRDSLDGVLAAGAPGSVAGLAELHRRYGTLPWPRLIAPAIRLADNGFVVDAWFARVLAYDAARLARYPGSAAQFLADGKPLPAGTHWRNRNLAATLRRVAAAGADGFYRGTTADLIVAEMTAANGLVTHADLAAYRPVWRDPVTFRYRGREVVSMPPPSSGGITLALIAGQLAQFDLARLGWHSAGMLHVQAEAMRRAFALRNSVLGDPDFVKIPRQRLLSAAFSHELAAGISTGHATPSSEITATSGSGIEPRHTTHFSVADQHGNLVALTTTVNGWHGCGVTVRGAGFLLNNEMDDFTSRPAVANQFGLVMGAANEIAPGKRMLSSMAPTLVFDRDGSPLLVTGASGGSHIITAVFELVSNRVDFDLGVAASMNAPRMHHQHLPDHISLEQAGFDADVAHQLRALGHEVVPFDTFEDGSIAATIERRDGMWYGAADPRVGGLAAGY
jgi:gamma-glutamyltranspeptidase / glutathione hydrolase